MKKLLRSRHNRQLTGLCGGLSEYLNIDVTVLRLILVFTSIFSSGGIFLIYLIASLFVPSENV